jgi:DNA invertase Pin-like site-specific DNA recombinase
MIKAVFYVRVSTGKQELDNQINQLKEYSIKKGYEIVHIYSDIISGKENSRPAFDKMFIDARKRIFELVLFWDLSRFSRSGTLFTLQKLRELENLGVSWESFQEPYFSSIGDFKDVVLSIMSTLAKIERQKISERTKAGLYVDGKLKANVGKRGKDNKPRKWRKDKGLKRTLLKSNDNLTENTIKDDN